MTGERKYFAGAAAATTLAANISSTADGITITVASDSGWPTGTTYPHLMVVNPGQSSEEKMLVKRTGVNTFQVETSGRGYDGTTAVTHSSGDAVEHRLDADTITRLVSHAFGDVLGNHDSEYRKLATAIVSGDITSLAGSKITGSVPLADAWTTGRTLSLSGDVTGSAAGVDGSANADIVTALAAGSVDLAHMSADSVGASQIVTGAVGATEIAVGGVIAGNIGAGAVETAKITDAAVTVPKIESKLGFQADDAAWAVWDPTWSGWTKGNGTLTGSVKKLGDLVTIEFVLVVGSTTSFGSQLILPLPFQINTNVRQGINLMARNDSANTTYPIVAVLQTTASGRLVPFSLTTSAVMDNTGLTSAVPFAWATDDTLEGQFSYRAA